MRSLLAVIYVLFVAGTTVPTEGAASTPKKAPKPVYSTGYIG